MAEDIIKDLSPTTKGLHEINRNLEAKRNRDVQRLRASKDLLVTMNLAETFLCDCVDDTVDKTFGI